MSPEIYPTDDSHAQEGSLPGDPSPQRTPMDILATPNHNGTVSPVLAGTQTSKSPALIHLILLTSVFLPIVFLPYIPLRRQLSSLHRKVDGLTTSTTALQSKFRTTLAEVALKNEERDNFKMLLSVMEAELSSLRQGGETELKQRKAEENALRKTVNELVAERDNTRERLSSLSQNGETELKQRKADAKALRKTMDELITERDNTRSQLASTKKELSALREEGQKQLRERKTSEDFLRGRVQELLAERDRTKSQLAALQDLGSSLADVAAFMHEVDLERGYARPDDSRRVETLRQLALRVQNSGKGKDQQKQKQK